MSNEVAKKLYDEGSKYYNQKDYENAFTLFKQAADMNYSVAQNDVGYCYEYGYGVGIDLQKALTWYLKSEDQGNLTAMCNAASLYKSGKISPINYQEALRLYHKAADKGSPLAYNQIGYMYDCGEGVPKNQAEAFRWYQKAADGNHASGCYNTAYYYENGYATAKNKDRALEYYKKAMDLGHAKAKAAYERLKKELNKVGYNDPSAETLFTEAKNHYDKKEYDAALVLFRQAANLGHTSAMHYIGVCYHNGYGKAVDYDEALAWYRKAAEKNHPSSFNQIGYFYNLGYGVKKDLDEAFRWYKKAADAGNSTGNYNVGYCYENGYGTAKDKQKAMEYYKKAMDLGDSDAKSKYEKLKAELDVPSEETEQPAKKLYDEGNKYFNKKDYVTAFALFKQAADMNFSNAVSDVGYCYEHGYGVEKDLFKALTWYLKAADQGNVTAMCNAGNLYKNGNEIPVNYQEALRLYRKAAEKGSPLAYNQLGYMYDCGYGVNENTAEAFYWYQKAAENNHPNGCYNIAVYYENGYATEKNKEKALEYYKKAKELGHQKAIEAYDRLYKELDLVSISFEEKPAQNVPVKNLSAQQELDMLIGMSSVKQEVKKIIQLTKYNEQRKAQNKAFSPVSRHMIFTGNPGTGKTTVARIIARLYHEMGIIQKPDVVEVDRSGLVAGYIGQTTEKVNKVIEKALGGVLFIDEAYSLTRSDSSNDYGIEAIDAILKAMEDNRDNLIVIAAGYTKEMTEFINSNPGLKSRFTNTIHFPDYSARELKEIFVQMTAKDGYKIDPKAHTLLDDRLDIMNRTRTKNFANAREVRNLYEAILKNRAGRAIQMSNDYDTILPEDIPPFIQKAPSDPIADLEALIGLASIKEEVKDMVSMEKYWAMRNKRPPITMHMVFSGNPGTGKTTVARLMANIYHNLGLLPTNNLVEVDRSALIGKYLGQTTTKTEAVIEQALGGVLFIDEAYSLVTGGSKEYGQEAIDVILKAMEDNRENLMVIAAGYPEEMDSFLSSNPGMASRFAKTLTFDDYTADELEKIFLHMAKNETLSDKAQDELRRIIRRISNRRTANFANAREVRIFYELVIKQLANRISRATAALDYDLSRIEESDLQEAEKKYFANKPQKSDRKNPIGFF